MQIKRMDHTLVYQNKKQVVMKKPKLYIQAH